MKIENDILPVGETRPALRFSHFPTRQQAVVWRNWNLVPVDIIAKTLKTNSSNVRKLANSMGLTKEYDNFSEWNRRGYLTIIRRNWHLLPYQQILDLLGWSAEKMRFMLKEDDSLWAKLGRVKPDTPTLDFRELTTAEQLKTKSILRTTKKYSCCENIKQPFDFFNESEYENNSRENLSDYNFKLKLGYSYSAVYGDPLSDTSIDPFPDQILKAYSQMGVNAVWMQAILYTLVPWLGDSEYSNGYQKRQEALRKLTKRLSKHGIKLFLYLNEPRCMPEAFFEKFPDWKGSVSHDGNAAICTSNHDALQALSDGMATLFKSAPELGGVFSITMSENQTHCRSKENQSTLCPVCAKRETSEFPVEIIKAIASGVHSVAPKADVIAWTWEWAPEWCLKAIEELPKKIKVMCVSERGLETNAMGIPGRVLDYSISKLGPGKVAIRRWKKANECGLGTVAKIQLNNSWECSAVPYIPVPNLIERHLQSIKECGVSDIMFSWTLGGYPGGNIELLNMSKEKIAINRFGEKASSLILQAYSHFSSAFEEFPLNGIAQLYYGPQNVGPMNLLFLEPTGYQATMVGFPYDDLKSWRGNHFPENVFEHQFKELSEKWEKGLRILFDAQKAVPKALMCNFADLANVSEAVYCHFRSSFLQIKFIRKRKNGCIKELIKILKEEIELAQRLRHVVRQDARIGFEASNHYYYTENDLLEKILNCEELIKTLRKQP